MKKIILAIYVAILMQIRLEALIENSQPIVAHLYMEQNIIARSKVEVEYRAMASVTSELI
jgi:hypothetical protein